MLDVITRRGDLELTLQIGAEILVSEDPRNRGDHPDNNNVLFSHKSSAVGQIVQYDHLDLIN